MALEDEEVLAMAREIEEAHAIEMAAEVEAGTERGKAYLLKMQLMRKEDANAVRLTEREDIASEIKEAKMIELQALVLTLTLISLAPWILE